MVQVLTKCGCLLHVIGFICLYNYAQCQIAEIEVNLIVPRWVSRGSTATLLCKHRVPNDLLYKVEFLRTGVKLLQYVRERTPPYVNYTTPGGKINMSLSTPNSMTIENIDFAATGYYWCEVSLETPIFTAASPPQLMTVVHPQKHPPIITFANNDIIAGGMLTANCTSAPAAPEPHLTWFVDEKEVNETDVRRYTYKVLSSYRSAGSRRKYHRQFENSDGIPRNHIRHQTTTLASTTVSNSTASQFLNVTNMPIKCRLKDNVKDELREPRRKPAMVQPPAQLTVSVSQLRLPAEGRVQLTCVSTVPAELDPGQQFADVKRQTVAVEVRKAHPDASKGKIAKESSAHQASMQTFHLSVILILNIIQ